MADDADGGRYGGGSGDDGGHHGAHAEPATTVIRLRPDPELIRAHRRRERRRTLTFLALFLGVIGTGLTAFMIFQGTWSWPFGGAGTTTALPCPTPTSVGLPAQQVTVRVYNASQRRGLAAGVAKALRERKFAIAQIGNDPQEAAVKDQALVRHGPAGLAAAKTVAAQVDGKVALVADDRLSQAVDLVIGQRWTKLRTPQQAARALTPVAASSPEGCVPVPAASPSASGS